MRLRDKLIIAVSLIGACALATGLVYYYQNANEVPLPKVTFDAQGGELELYDQEKVNISFRKGMRWSDFYQQNDYFGATKDNYDFLYWSLDGENPIPSDYILTEPVTLKPVYVKNRDCVTISCRYFDPRFSSCTIGVYYDSPTSASLLCSHNGGSFKRCENDMPINFSDETTYVSFKSTGVLEIAFYNYDDGQQTRLAVSGNINALCNYQDDENINFIKMFYGMNLLTSARGLVLPSTKLNEAHYSAMFSSCSSLVSAPKILPASEIPDDAYARMFDGCSSLKQIPDISSIKKIHELSCKAMFSECVSIVSGAENFNPEIIGEDSCSFMFNGCLSLVNGPKALSANKHYADNGDIEPGLGQECYRGMFENCVSLDASPELSATILGFACYSGMFRNCSSLKSIKINYTGEFDSYDFDSWVENVYPTGDFYYNGSDLTRSVSAIPEGWTVHQF